MGESVPVEPLSHDSLDFRLRYLNPQTQETTISGWVQGQVPDGEIAEIKKEHLNAIDTEGAVKVIAGTARSMGVEIAE